MTSGEGRMEWKNEHCTGDFYLFEMLFIYLKAIKQIRQMLRFDKA